jgi:hypothetical protein
MPAKACVGRSRLAGRFFQVPLLDEGEWLFSLPFAFPPGKRVYTTVRQAANDLFHKIHDSVH